MAQPRLTVRDYHVGWICAIDIECGVACELLDEELADPIGIPEDDENINVWSSPTSQICHRLPPQGRRGAASAAHVARDMHRSLPAIRIRLMDGIAGGAPTKKHDIRLGDVVVSSPDRRSGGVMQYGHGKTIQNRQFKVTGSLDRPSSLVLHALQKFSVQHERRSHAIAQTIELM
ncbi:uncharacterized protein Z519_02966 [Cladophialophora bantiana CBS 173.52]|uniref:Uncharacterized protein n=1 Tax=Cladophialophora bantiana (strain ATCC 10958 / CBS 173.52 / CDC B-1940 / NIH 8579) TaxID=1442370 RepID=A0A0D2F128_CLAB1|nr:uncharacterized protein Z519_02966 [Cladophialophora bantiana CBS 173.52]KIW95901.1 hypothetical protein Z519_02966 [Cladophialophora bantiana CBS 173.52]